MTTVAPSLLEVALSASRRGLSVHPPAEDGTKAPVPLYPKSGGGDGRTWLHPPGDLPTEEVIRRWYGPHSGIGLRTGSEAAGLECLEFDCPQVYTSFTAAANECGLGGLLARIEAGYRELTPGAGVHLLYFTDEIQGNAKLAKRPDVSPTKLHGAKTLIETRGENGFVIIAPSGGKVHQTGRPYVLTSGGIDSIVTLTGEERAAMFELARSFDEMPKPLADDKPKGRPPTDTSARPGDLYGAAVSWDEIMTGAGWHLAYRRGETTYWRRPDKAIGVSATTNHNGSNLLWVFTSSTSLDSEKSYTKFGAYAHLNHGGNHTAAAKTLREAGYKAPASPGERSRSATQAVSQSDPSVEEGAANEAEIADLWPELDGAAYHGIIGEFVRLAEPHTESDPVGVLIQVLIGFANMVGRGPHWHAGADTHYLTMFAALVGSTASGRKGSSWGVARTLLDRTDPEWTAKNVSSGLSSGEGLIYAVRDRVVKSDGEGGETEVDPGVLDKRLLLIESEFGRTLRVMARDGSTLSQVLRQVWDCEPNLGIKTRNSPCVATGAHISVVGHISKTELTSLLAKNDTAGGLANRFLWLCVRRSKSLPSGGRFHEVDWSPLVERMREIVAFAREVGTMRRDEDAAQIWERTGSVYDELTKGRPGSIGAILGRPEAQVMRLSCIYALLDRSPLVRPAHLRAALAIWDYVDASATLIFGETLTDPQAEHLLAALRSAPDGLTRSQIQTEVFGGHLKTNVIGRLLEELLGMGLVYSETRNDGRPGRNPQVWRSGVKFRRPKLYVPEDAPASA